jgi:hypothetical protein
MRSYEAQANSLINLGIGYKQAGDNEKTLAAFGEVERIFQRDAWFSWRYNIRLQAGKCEHWPAQGELGKAEECARRLLETATYYEARKYIAVAHYLLAQVAMACGDLGSAEEKLGQCRRET